MRDDLLDSQACVDWAVGQIDIFRNHLTAWLERRPYTATPTTNPDTGGQIWSLDEVEPIPRVINAEAGAIINSLRSALDVLANKLAERNNQGGKRDVYFPICYTQASFNNGNNAGRKKIKRLSAPDQDIIKSLQPYYIGDVQLLLGALHDLDIERKHRKLIDAYSSPHGIGVTRYDSLPEEFQAILRAQAPTEGYVFRRAVDPDHHIEIRIEVSLAHVGPLTTKPIVEALLTLAAATIVVINRFDA